MQQPGFSFATEDIVGITDEIWLRSVDYSIVLMLISWFWKLYNGYVRKYLCLFGNILLSIYR